MFCRNSTTILLSEEKVDENDPFCEENGMIQSSIRTNEEFEFILGELRKVCKMVLDSENLLCRRFESKPCNYFKPKQSERQLNGAIIWNTVKKYVSLNKFETFEYVLGTKNGNGWIAIIEKMSSILVILKESGSVNSKMILGQ